ncbi:MAG TPA: transcriptional regulator, partial [Pyrinomonadaceae bacterium]
MSSQTEQHFYEFGPFRVDALKRLLLRDGQSVPLTAKAFDTLLTFVRHSGQDLDKNELMQAVWPDQFVEENNLTQNVSMLRKALGEQRSEHRYIVTIPGRGYRFVASVREVCDAQEQEQEEKEEQEQVTAVESAVEVEPSVEPSQLPPHETTAPARQASIASSASIAAS